MTSTTPFPSGLDPERAPNSGKCTVKCEIRGEYLYALISAHKLEPHEMFDCLQKVIDECEKHKAENVIIDLNVPSLPHLRELYQVATLFYRANGDRKTCFVNRYGYNHGKLDFMLLAYRRGGGNGEVYRKVETAEQWIARNS